MPSFRVAFSVLHRRPKTMTEVGTCSHEPSQNGRVKSHRLSILRKIRHRRSDSGTESRSSVSHSHSRSPVRPPSAPSRLPSLSGVRDSLPFETIAGDFSDLRDAIFAHVNKYYIVEPLDGGATQATIAHASTGITIPWSQIRTLLDDGRSRLAMIGLCISWTILSRSLLLNVGISNAPGSSLLPPEIVECFQSFSLGKGALSLDMDEAKSVNFALLSRWKQISATLSHSTYVADAFSHFDSRTVNIERALNDLEPLLRTYAIPHDGDHGKVSRLADLRGVLRQGATFAFTLFSQPSFWKFDWTSDRALQHGKTDQLEPGKAPSIETSAVGVGSLLTPAEIVVWPSLVKVVDGDGYRTEAKPDEFVFGLKKYLDEYEKA